MFTRSAAHALAPSCLLVSAAALLWGCTGTSSGNDPAIRRRFDVLADQIAELQADIEDSRQTLADLSAQAGAGGPGGAAAPAEIANLQATDQELQRAIDELRQQMERLSSDLEVAQGQRSVTTTLTPASDARPAAQPPAETAAPAPPPEVASSPAPPPAEAAPEEAPGASEPEPRVRGTWHTFSDGESLASIASHYNIPVERLLEVNALPPNVRLFPGQRLFIPQGS